MSARVRRAIAALALAWLSGCYLFGADGPHFADYDPVPQGKARLYVYRPSHPQGGWVAVKVRLDGDALVRLRDSGYASLTLPPGEYELEAAWPLLFFDASPHGGPGPAARGRGDLLPVRPDPEPGPDRVPVDVRHRPGAELRPRRLQTGAAPAGLGAVTAPLRREPLDAANMGAG